MASTAADPELVARAGRLGELRQPICATCSMAARPTIKALETTLSPLPG